MIAQTDHPYMLEWLSKAARDGGSFISAMGRAGLVADDDNYALLRTVLWVLRAKYPAYEPSDAVKAELAKAVAEFEVEAI